MSLRATLTIEVSMIAIIRPSMTVRVIMISGGLARSSARRAAEVRTGLPPAARDALMTTARGGVSW